MDMPYSMKFAKLAGACKAYRRDNMRTARKYRANNPKFAATFVESARAWNRLLLIDLKAARDCYAQEVSRAAD